MEFNHQRLDDSVRRYADTSREKQVDLTIGVKSQQLAMLCMLMEQHSFRLQLRVFKTEFIGHCA